MMIVGSLFLMLMGIFLSAFFSGSETGFYRASRVKVVIAGLEGDRVSRYLIKLINNPTLFVATTLIGNNGANYLTSLAIVLLTLEVTHSGAAEMLAPIFMSPILFVYGELLPKNLFYHAPNLMLRRAAPLFLFFTCLFAPVAALLWGIGYLLERVLGQSPQRIRLALARKELQQVIEDGLEAGILHPTQRHLAQSFFLNASKPVLEICTPVSRIQAVRKNTKRAEALRFARQKRIADIPVYEENRMSPMGYVRTVDLMVDRATEMPVRMLREFMDVRSTELFGEAILQMQSARETLARVVDENDQVVGLLSIDQLTEPLMNGPLGSLQR